MPKSNYPEKLDTSVEILPVRDNLLEVGSDVINSVRSALFNIERTLGINPQGAVGRTVAERLNQVLDGNGNLLKSAIDRANVLSGPITDTDVAKSAAIQESKLKLQYPTTLLQSEISILNSQVDTINQILSDLVAELSAHLNRNASDRHPATAVSISLDDILDPSDEAAFVVESSSVQGAIEKIYDSHIHYSGENISPTNRSHASEQIYFDSSNVLSITNADDVQEAIEDVANSTLNAQIVHQDLFHSNGILRNDKMGSGENISPGALIAELGSISFSARDGSTDITNIVFSVPLESADFNISESDILTIIDEADTDGNFAGDYEVQSIELSGSQIIGIFIYGTFNVASTVSTTGRITRANKAVTNPAALLVVGREDPDLTSSKVLQICNPNAAKIISIGLNPFAITSTNRYFNISIDGNDPVQVDAYDSAASRQSIDTIVSRINEKATEDHLSITAYRLDQETGQSELVIAHTAPDVIDLNRTLQITDSIDDGTTALGFLSVKDIEHRAIPGTSFFIQGEPKSGLSFKMNQVGGLIFSAGDDGISVGNTGISFLDLGIREDDLLVITGAETPQDDGTYVVVAVTDTQLSLSPSQFVGGFAAGSADETYYQILNSTVQLDNLTFQEVSSSFGAILGDVFIDKNRQPFFDKRVEYAAEVLVVESLISIVDFQGDISGKSFELSASIGDDGFIDLSLDDGEVVKVIGTRNYVRIISGKDNVEFKLYIPDASAIDTKITSLALTELVITFYGFVGVNPDTNFLLGRVLYDAFRGRIGGGEESSRATAIAQMGNIGPLEINQNAKRVLLHQPLNELRSNGLIYGGEVTEVTIDGDGLYVISTQRMVVYVGGKRFEVPKYDDLQTDIDSTSIDKFYIFVDEFGNVITEPANGDICASDSVTSELAFLASVEKSGSTVTIQDLRLFIDELDLKLLNSITVSPQVGMGHFSDVGKAIKYAKRFSEIFPKAGIPTVHLKSGTHKVLVSHNFSSSTSVNSAAAYTDHYRDGIWINFPINIVGEGESTVLNLFEGFTDAPDPDDADKTSVDYARGRIIIAGSGLTTLPDQDPNLFNSGFIKISDLKLRNSKIDALDVRVKDGSNNKLNFGIKVDNVIFDNTEDSNFDSNNHGIFIRNINVASGTKIGNILIDRCEFLNSHIRFSQNAADIRNIIISSNISRGTGNTTTGGQSNYLIRVDGTGNIFSFTNALSENNIDIRSNIIADNDVANTGVGAPHIDDDGSLLWGDRISRLLSIGHEVRTPQVNSQSSAGLRIASDNGGNVKIESGNDVIISSGNTFDINITSDGDINLTAAENIVATSALASTYQTTSGDLNLIGADDVNLIGADDVNITSGTDDINLLPADRVNVGTSSLAKDIAVFGSYVFGNTQKITRFYTMDMFNKNFGDTDFESPWVIDGATGGSATFSTLTFTADGDDLLWPRIGVANTGTANDGRAKLPIILNDGETLTGITIGLNNTTTPEWTVSVYRPSLSGGNTITPSSPYTLEDSDSSIAVAIIAGAQIHDLSFSLNVAATSTTPYFITISHDQIFSTYYVYWMRITVEVSSVQQAFGANNA